MSNNIFSGHAGGLNAYLLFHTTIYIERDMLSPVAG